MPFSMSVSFSSSLVSEAKSELGLGANKQRSLLLVPNKAHCVRERYVAGRLLQTGEVLNPLPIFPVFYNILKIYLSLGTVES